MHFYPFNIGDYASATAHLEPLEDLAYRRLLDLYYSTEQPIPLNLTKVARLIRMRAHSESIAVVLEDFFKEEEDGYHCNRIDIELFKYHEKSEKASNSAKARWNKAKLNQTVKKKSERNANALNTQCEGNAKQETRNKNKETLNNAEHPSASRFIEFWDLYAKKKDTAKCKSKFEKLSNTDVDKIFEVLPLYIESTPDVKFRKHPATWLNNKCWLDANDAEQLEYIDWEAIKDYYNESMPEDKLAVITKARQNKIIIMLTNTGRVGKMQSSLEGHIDNMARNDSGFWPSWREGNTDAKGNFWKHKGFDFYMSEEIFLKSLED